MLAGKYDREGRGPAGGRLTDPKEDDVMRPWKERMFTPRSFEVVETVGESARDIETTSASLSIGWLLEQPAVTSVIIGPRSVEQLDGNWAALELDLPEAVLDRLDEVSSLPETYLQFMQGSITRSRIQDLE
jgi:aryl-alcohol dehydrogenase-like predicted oxidoreductase